MNRVVSSKTFTSLNTFSLRVICLSCLHSRAGLDSPARAATVSRYRLRSTLQSVPKRTREPDSVHRQPPVMSARLDERTAEQRLQHETCLRFSVHLPFRSLVGSCECEDTPQIRIDTRRRQHNGKVTTGAVRYFRH